MYISRARASLAAAVAAIAFGALLTTGTGAAQPADGICYIDAYTDNWRSAGTLCGSRQLDMDGGPQGAFVKIRYQAREGEKFDDSYEVGAGRKFTRTLLAPPYALNVCHLDRTGCGGWRTARTSG